MGGQPEQGRQWWGWREGEEKERRESKLNHTNRWPHPNFRAQAEKGGHPKRKATWCEISKPKQDKEDIHVGASLVREMGWTLSG